MNHMRLDHLSYAVGPEGLTGTTERLSELLGEKFVDGGVHPRFGTTNMIMPLTGGQYLEVVEVLDHPASDKAAFGQAVRARSEAGGGWLGWVVRVDDIVPIEERLDRRAVRGNRHRPDGVELRWRQIGVKGLQADPQLPFFVHWDVPVSLHPSNGATGDVSLVRMQIAGDRARVADWLGVDRDFTVGPQEIDWVSGPPPGLNSATFKTPDGPVTI